ncbi:hypothetical protein VIBNIENn2_490033 [Vibrio nigripulchritudo ENn2]|nr:hypothetical protein VIBNIENn2_490033 [Vibrio nigripulchritudo ENn2]
MGIDEVDDRQGKQKEQVDNRETQEGNCLPYPLKNQTYNSK